jgi:hypothetical protein
MPKNFIERKTTLSNGDNVEGFCNGDVVQERKKKSKQSKNKEAYCLIHFALGWKKWLKEKEKLNKKGKKKKS